MESNHNLFDPYITSSIFRDFERVVNSFEIKRKWELIGLKKIKECIYEFNLSNNLHKEFYHINDYKLVIIAQQVLTDEDKKLNRPKQYIALRYKDEWFEDEYDDEYDDEYHEDIKPEIIMIFMYGSFVENFESIAFKPLSNHTEFLRGYNKVIDDIKTMIDIFNKLNKTFWG